MPTAPLLAIALALSLPLPLPLSSSQSSVSILHDSIDCVAPGDHPVVKAAIDPGFDVRSAKVYFRSEKYPKFYFVAMSPEAGTFTSVLPRPSAETTRIIYYIEAVDTTFTSVVGPEHVVDVRADCVQPDDDSPKVASAPPEIVVGSVEAGAPALPPGFETAGIVGTIASTGILTGLGGGSGIGTAAVVGGIAAAGAGGAVVAATATGGEKTPPPKATEPPAPAPSAPAPSPSSPSPPPDAPPSPTPTPAPTPSPTPTPPPEPPTPASLVACFRASFPGKSCNLKLDAGCSTGSILSWDWVIDAPASLGGSTTHSGQTVNRNFPQCAGETVRVSLTVSGTAGARSSTSQKLTLPVMLETPAEQPLAQCTIASLLSPRGFWGNVVLDAVRTETVEGAIPSSLSLRTTASEHEVEAYLVALAGPANGERVWTFDLSHCPSLTPGSLTSVQGTTVAGDATRISFRLAGAPGERIRFRFRLSH